MDAGLRGGVVRADDAAGLGRDGGEVDDPAPLRRPHARQHGLRDQEYRLQVDGQHLVPVLFCDLVDRLRAGDPGVVHQDSHRPKLAFDLLDHPNNIGGDRHVGLEGHGPAAHSPGSRGRLPRRPGRGSCNSPPQRRRPSPGPRRRPGRCRGWPRSPRQPCHRRSVGGTISLTVSPCEGAWRRSPR